MQNTCLNPRSNSQSGCPNGGTTVTGTLSSTGTRSPVNNTAAVCNEAFSQGSGQPANLQSAGTSIYDSGTVFCSPTSYGYLFFQNNCPATAGASAFTIQVSSAFTFA